MRRATLVGIGALLLAGGCGRAPQGAWQRVDLTTRQFVLEAAPQRVARRKPLRTVSALLGAPGETNFARLPKRERHSGALLLAGEVLALDQAAGTTVRTRLPLGRAPYFSFTPLRSLATPCACRMRVAVRVPGAPSVEVASWQPDAGKLEPVAADTPAPAALEVDLARWAGREIDLALTVDAYSEAGADGSIQARALWGSPAVYSRGEPVSVRPPAPAAARPNILLVGADTLRADALGAWGRAPSATPALDRLAAESDVFLDAYSCFNVTNPSFTSTLTGLYGKNHGTYDLVTPLPAERTTLAELLESAGYATYSVISARHLDHRASGLGQGFAGTLWSPGQFAAERAVDGALSWLEQHVTEASAPAGQSIERPFFLWLHLFDPHTPHTPPAPYALGLRPARAEGLARVTRWTPFRPEGAVTWSQRALGGHAALYAGEVAYLDHQIDRLLDWLDSRGRLADTVVVFFADHGENVDEHGLRFQHAGLWDTTTHVPLMIRWAGTEARGRRLRGFVQNVDLFPTLARAAGVTPPPSDGIDLRELIRAPAAGGGALEGRRAVFAEHANRAGAMVRTRSMLLYRSLAPSLVPPGLYLHDLRADPRQETNLAGRGLAAETELGALLDRWLADHDTGPRGRAVEISAEDAARLRALGYL